MKELFEKLIYTEVPEGFTHPLVRPVGIIWGVSTSALLFGLIFIFGSLEGFEKAYAYFESKEQKLFLNSFLLITFLCVFYRVYYAVQGVLQHDKRLSYKLEDRYIVFVLSSVIFQQVLIGVIFSMTSLVLYLQGVSISESFEKAFELRILSDWINGLVAQVPSLLNLPYYWALLIAHVSISLVAYLWHRLGHESRLLWLLAHRPHHVSTTLSSATVFEADPRFLLGIFWRYLMFGLIGGAITKIISGDFYFIEVVMIGMLAGTLEIHNHVSAYYEVVRKNKMLMFVMHALGGQGPYHYVHHSAEPGETIVNLGGGWFLLWDRIFGTYITPPMKKPKVGLTGQPEIYLNPVNLALSGLLQIIYELRHNPVTLWLRILFGGVYYMPPKTKKYLYKHK